MNTSLILRVCRSNFTSYDGFKWPNKVGADIIAPDWKNTKECGNGLHGWLYGDDGNTLSVDYWREPDAKWMVLEVQTAEIVELDGKCKFPRATIRFIGKKEDAAKFMRENEPRAKVIIGEKKVVGEKESVSVGALGTAIADEYGTATVGNYGTAIAENYGTAIADEYGTAIAENYGKATAGINGKATAGINGKASAGNYGTAIAGDRGTAAAGYNGTASAGNNGTATVGNYGKVSASEYGEIHIRYFDKTTNRYRTKIGYVGENGIEPNVFYKLDENYEFEKA